MASIFRDGAYAEYIFLRASEVAPKPESLDYVLAAAVRLAALTAWRSLFDLARLRAGQIREMTIPSGNRLPTRRKP